MVETVNSQSKQKAEKNVPETRKALQGNAGKDYGKAAAARTRRSPSALCQNHAVQRALERNGKGSWRRRRHAGEDGRAVKDTERAGGSEGENRDSGDPEEGKRAEPKRAR